MPNPFLLAALPGIVSGLGNMAASIFTNRSQRKEARRMNAYNTPAAQMERYRKAGLSPYLIYGQGTPGNMSSPVPAVESGLQEATAGVQKGMDDYFAIRQKGQDYQSSTIQNSILRYQNRMAEDQQRSALYEADIKALERQRTEAEFFADFPEYISQLEDKVTPSMVNSSFRMKMNELKRAAAKSSLDRLNLMIKNQGYKNTVDRVKAKYASDYGMVGGDWTQGLGLLKSLKFPRIFNKVRGGSNNKSKVSFPKK